MRWLLQGTLVIWLLFLSLLGWVVQFNKFGDLSIVDCDNDAETGFVSLVFLIWLTTLLILAVNLACKYWFKTKPFWFAGGLSTVLSIAPIPKFIEWLQYNAELSQHCP
jgi:glucan phosphoethanolaminetransferase (alkaline phosphatase superfamily)